VRGWPVGGQRRTQKQAVGGSRGRPKRPVRIALPQPHSPRGGATKPGLLRTALRRPPTMKGASFGRSPHPSDGPAVTVFSLLGLAC